MYTISLPQEYILYENSLFSVTNGIPSRNRSRPKNLISTIPPFKKGFIRKTDFEISEDKQYKMNKILLVMFCSFRLGIIKYGSE